jgi:hypothetical protein
VVAVAPPTDAKPAAGDSWDLNPDDIAPKAAAKDDAPPDTAKDEPTPGAKVAGADDAQAAPKDEPKDAPKDEVVEAEADDEPKAVRRSAPRPGAKDRAAYTKATNAFEKAMKKQGLVPGDVPDVDAEALRARLLAKQGKLGDAADAMEKATDGAAAAKITRGLVLKKLDRFNKRYDKVETPAQKEKLKPLSTEISQKLAGVSTLS